MRSISSVLVPRRRNVLLRATSPSRSGLRSEPRALASGFAAAPNLAVAVLVCGSLVWFAGIALAQPATQFNVKNFGAVGDGVRSDTDSINKTIQAASDAGGGSGLTPPP